MIKFCGKNIEWLDIQVVLNYIAVTNINRKKIKNVRLHSNNFLRLKNLKYCFNIKIVIIENLVWKLTSNVVKLSDNGYKGF